MFGKKKDDPYTTEDGVRGGCSVHDMRGPVRRGKGNFKQASKDASAHFDRFHAKGDGYGGYVEGGL